MVYFVLGGSASGKSEYAEQLAVKLMESGSAAGIYIATMRRSASAGERIRKHVERRRGLGFETLENEILILSETDRDKIRGAVVLLEDLPNLLANRMFDRDEHVKQDEKGTAALSEESTLEAKEKSWLLEGLKEDIKCLSESAKSLILVSGDIFRDGMHYDEKTEEYIENLGDLHRWLAGKADQTVEVVCGIPISD